MTTTTQDKTVDKLAGRKKDFKKRPTFIERQSNNIKHLFLFFLEIFLNIKGHFLS